MVNFSTSRLLRRSPAVEVAIRFATSSATAVMLASISEYTPSNTLADEPDTRPNTIPRTANTTITVSEMRSTPCSVSAPRRESGIPKIVIAPYSRRASMAAWLAHPGWQRSLLPSWLTVIQRWIFALQQWLVAPISAALLELRARCGHQLRALEQFHGRDGQRLGRVERAALADRHARSRNSLPAVGRGAGDPGRGGQAGGRHHLAHIAHIGGGKALPVSAILP